MKQRLSLIAVLSFTGLFWAVGFAPFPLLLLLLSFFCGAVFLQLCISRKRGNKWHVLLNSLQEGVAILNWEGDVVTVNLAGQQIVPSLAVGSSFFSHPLFAKQQALFIQCKKPLAARAGAVSSARGGVHLQLTILQEKKRIVATFTEICTSCQKAQQGKDFVANASHELRTPITIIKGFAETIYDLPEISEPMLQDFTEKIVRNCERMESLVKSLLTVADLDYLPEVRFQECDLVGLVDNCSHTLLTLYPTIQITCFHKQEKVVVAGDPDLLELAVMNLLENGVKYSSGPALMNITVEEKKGEVILIISDRGIGIPAEDLDKIFDRFYTINKSHSKQLGGAGLGLSIVKTILSKHRAQIEVRSTLGQETHFTLTFQKSRQLFPPFR